MLSSLRRCAVETRRFRLPTPISTLPSRGHFFAPKGEPFCASKRYGVRTYSAFFQREEKYQAAALTEDEINVLGSVNVQKELADLLTLQPSDLEQVKALGFLHADLASFDADFGDVLRKLNALEEFSLVRKLYEKFGPFNKLDGFAAREYVVALQQSRDSIETIQRIRSLLSQTKQTSEAEPLHLSPESPFLPRLNGLVAFLVLTALAYDIYLTIQGEEIMSILKTPKFQQAQDIDVTLEDVKGNYEAKEELSQLVEFLKNPSKFSGVKMPKGVLLSGPPGTGKTLLARALAGEAGVPFLAVSGSEFDEVFVGVGAKRIRELFQNAKTLGPCIIFIDEIDTIGGQRKFHKVSGISSTLNQLLVELDGFNNRDGIIIIGATNLPQYLDPALVRPGRFDRRVSLDLPSRKERQEILTYYLKKHKCEDSILTDGVKILANQTAGLSGAELDNLVNMAAFHAAKIGTNIINLGLLERALLDTAVGKEKKSAILSARVKKCTAIHEGGHALVALFTKDAPRIRMATIMPRGQALGLVSYMGETEDNKTKSQLMAEIKMAMGGRAAEELYFGKEGVTTGAESDFASASRYAYSIVARYGMNDKVGPIVLAQDKVESGTQSSQAIETEAKLILETAYEEAKFLLQEKRVELDRLAAALLVHETLSREEIEKVIAGEPIGD